MEKIEKLEEIMQYLLLRIQKDSERPLPKFSKFQDKLNFVRTYTVFNSDFCDEEYTKSEMELLSLYYEDEETVEFNSVGKDFGTKNIFNIDTGLLIVVSELFSSELNDIVNLLGFRFGVGARKNMTMKVTQTFQKGVKHVCVINDISSPVVQSLKNVSNEINNAIIYIDKNIEIRKKYLKNDKKINKNAKLLIKTIKKSIKTNKIKIFT